MRPFKPFLFLSSLFLLLAGVSAHALTVAQMNACIEKLAAGENRVHKRIPKAAMEKVLKGYKTLGSQVQKRPVALIVDYSRSSKEKRSFLIDFGQCEVLAHDYVAHGGAYSAGGTNYFDGDPDGDGILDTCKNRNGTRTNMTRPGLYITRGCHRTQQTQWTHLQDDCEGIKLHGLEASNDDAMSAAVVLHEHELMKENGSVKHVGQGCPTYAKGRLKSMLRYGLFANTLVVVHAPQCR